MVVSNECSYLKRVAPGAKIRFGANLTIEGVTSTSPANSQAEEVSSFQFGLSVAD